jgi:hypothetical protein
MLPLCSIHMPSRHLLALVVALVLLSGCSADAVGGTTVKRNGLPLTFSFDDDCNGFTGTEGGATSACDDGQFRVAVKRPDGRRIRPQQDYLFRFEQPTAGLVVSADMKLTDGVPSDQALGVACVASEYGQPGQEYVFALSGTYAGIFLRDETLASRPLRQLAYKRISGLDTGSTHHVDGECATLSGGTTLLVMRLDGDEVLREYTRARYPKYVASSLWMFTLSGGSFVFDNLAARSESRIE